MAQSDRLVGFTAAEAIKAPCRAATTINTVLTGLQTIDGVSLVADDRVLVRAQTDGVENGIYLVKSTAWVRAKDFDGQRDVVGGTVVHVTEGSLSAGREYQVDGSGSKSPGTDIIAFSVRETGTLDSDITVVSSIANLRALDTSTDDEAFVTGYYADGDGGGGHYTYDSGSSASDNNGTVIAPDVGSGRWLLVETHPVTVKQFGAKGDNSTDDRASIQAAIDAVSVAGGGIVIIQEGTYLFGSALIYKSNVAIRGLGRGATTLKVADSADDHGFNTSATVADASIESMTIDGNRTGQAGGTRAHCIRSADDMERVVFRDLHILNSSGYGIGLQGTADDTGLLEDILIENCHIESSGVDGIDIKNRADANVGVKISNVFVKDFDQQGDGSKNGIDVRGQCLLDNIYVDLGTVNTNSGIVFRDGGPGSASGTGGRYSSLTNFYVKGDGAATGSVGVQILNREVTVANGYISNAFRGIRFTGDKSGVSNVRIIDVLDNAVRIEAGADQNMLDNITVIDSLGVSFYIAGNNNKISDSISVDTNTVGNFSIASGANNNVLANNQTTGAGTEYNDSGTNTLISKIQLQGTGTTLASVAGNFSATRYIPITDGEGNTWYVPCSASTW